MKIIGEAERDKGNGSRRVTYQCDCGYVGTTRSSRFKLIKCCSACSRKTAQLQKNSYVVIGEFCHVDVSTKKFPDVICVIDAKNIAIVIDGNGRWFATNFGKGTIYAVRGQRSQKMHRHILGSGSEDVDHIDGDGLNNTEKNIVSGTHAENMRNRCMDKRNTSGVIGVTRCKKSGSWLAQGGFGGDHFYLGIFSEIDGAINARKEFENKFCFNPNHGRLPR